MSGLFFETNFGSESVYILKNGVPEKLWNGAAGNSGNPSAPSTTDGGSPVLSYGGLVYFNGLDGNGSDNLMIYNAATNKTINYELSKNVVWGSGLNPQDFVENASSVYFIGQAADPGLLAGPDPGTLWVTNGASLAAIHEVADSPIDNGQMASYRGNLYFNGQGSDGNVNDFMEYNAAQKNNAQHGFSEVSGAWAGLNPQDTTAATLRNGSVSAADLFFNGVDQSNNQDLFIYNGSTLKQLGAAGLDPQDLTSFSYGHVNAATGAGGATAIMFNGADGSSAQHPGVDGAATGRGLYMVIESSTGVLKDTLVAAGLDPQDITALDGELFFAAVDGNKNDPSAEGLWVYNPTARSPHQLQEIVSSANYDLDMNASILGTLAHPQAQMAASGGDLYFDATHGGTVQGLFAYNPLTNHISTHISGTAGSLPFNLIGV
jgi:hypothetical protein